MVYANLSKQPVHSDDYSSLLELSEKETFAQELYRRMCLDVKENKARVIFEMKEVNRQVVMCVLDKIEKDGIKEFLSYLEAWKMLEVKKVAARIIEVENEIAGKVM